MAATYGAPGVYIEERPNGSMPLQGVGTAVAAFVGFTASYDADAGGQLKPGLDITVTATVDSTLLVAAGPPVERYTIGTTPTGGDRNGRSFVGGRTDEAPGTMVSTPHGAVELGTDGTFLVPAEAGDQLSVAGEPRLTIGDTGSADIRETPAKDTSS